MPPLRLTNGKIEKACEMRAYGGSDGACARHAGVKPQTFYHWLHFGEVLRDYLDNGRKFNDPEYYRTWSKDADVVITKLKREIEDTGGTLSKEHKSYLKLWDGLMASQDVVISECHETIDRAKKQDPNWALKVIKWFYPEEYKDDSQNIRLSGADGGPINLHVIYDTKPDA